MSAYLQILQVRSESRHSCRGVAKRQGLGDVGWLGRVFSALLLCFDPTNSAIAEPKQASSSQSPTVVMIGGETFSSAAVECPSSGEHIAFGRDGQEPREISASQLVRWGHPSQEIPSSLIVLSDDSQVAGAEAWEIEQLVNVSEESVTWQSRSSPKLDLPRTMVKGVILQAPAGAHRFHRLLQDLKNYDQTQDTIVTKNNDRISGDIQEWSRDVVAMTSQSVELSLPMSQIVAAFFNSAYVLSPPDGAPFVALGMEDGSLLMAATWNCSEESLSGKLVAGHAFSAWSATELVFVQMHGGRVSYLSDLVPQEQVHQPFFRVPWPMRQDLNVKGGRLSTNGKNYFKGLGMMSRTQTVYRIPPQADRFCADVAIDGMAGVRGSVVFRVLLADKSSWNQAYESPVVRGGDAPRAVSVDVRGSVGLALVVEFADRGDEADYANWLDARFELTRSP